MTPDFSLIAAAFFAGLALGAAAGVWALLHVDSASGKG